MSLGQNLNRQGAKDATEYGRASGWRFKFCLLRSL
jgi:hypothetical protein